MLTGWRGDHAGIALGLSRGAKTASVFTTEGVNLGDNKIRHLFGQCGTDRCDRFPE